VHEFPETQEEITVWRLEHASYQYSQYMHYVQDNNRFEHSLARELVFEWLARIAKLDGIVRGTRMLSKNGYYHVSVAGILVCVLSEIDLKAMYNGETRV
jgi:hypothetical protein